MKKNKKVRTKKRVLLNTILVAMLFAISIFGVRETKLIQNLKRLLDGPIVEPAHSKTLTPNKVDESHPDGNGTYELELSIKGAIKPDKLEANANVLIVYDVSGSMNNQQNTYYYVTNETGGYGLVNGDYVDLYRNTSGSSASGYSGDTYYYSGNRYHLYEGDRYVRTNRRNNAMEKVIHDFAHDLYTYNEDSNLQMALIAFSSLNHQGVYTNTEAYHGDATNAAWIVQEWTDDEETFNSNVSDTGTSHIMKDPSTNQNIYGGGTNWEAGLEKAYNYLGETTTDGDATYVIFITDGEPTYNNKGGDGKNAVKAHYNAAKVWAKNIKNYDTAKHEVDAETSNTTFYGIYAYGNSTKNYLDDLMYYAHNGDDTGRSVTLDSNPDPSTEGYYFLAQDQADVEEAIKRILLGIVKSVGVTNVSITDGTTSHVELSSGKFADLLEFETDENNQVNFSYWMSKSVETGSGSGYSVVTNPSKPNERTEYFKYRTSRIDRGSGEEFYVYIQDLGNNKVRCVYTRPSDKKYVDVEVTGNVKDGELTIQWLTEEEGGNAAELFFGHYPPAARIEDGAVKWDLTWQDDEPLLNDVTYSVKFNVWKTQYVFDLIADLENGTVEYSELDSETGSEKYKGLDQYISKDCSGSRCFYRLKTNTVAYATYTDTSEENPQPHTVYYETPEGIEVKSDTISIHKNWRNYLPNQKNVDKIKVNLIEDIGTQNEAIHFTTTLSSSGDESLDWKNKDPIYIAPGILLLETTKGSIATDPVTGEIILDPKTGEQFTKDTGTIKVLEPGHDYTFAELDENENENAFNYELVSETVHPMLVNGILTELIKMDEELLTSMTPDDDPYLEDYHIPREMLADENLMFVTSDNNRQFVRLKAGGPVYLIANNTDPTIEAFNYRRSNLNVNKKVNGDYAPKDALFPFTINVNDKSSEDGELLYFSVFDSSLVVNDEKEGFVDILEDGRLEGTGIEKATTTDEEGATEWNGYYTIPNNSELVAKLKASENLRFINLPTKTTYTVVEGKALEKGSDGLYHESENFAYDRDNTKVSAWYYGKTSSLARYLTEEELTYTKENNTTKIDGTIDYTNTDYHVTYENVYKLVNVSVEKIWDDNDDQDGLREKNHITSVLIQLYRKTESDTSWLAYGDPVTINDSTEWKNLWENLPRYQDNNLTKEYTYKVEEVIDPDSVLKTDYTQTIIDKSMIEKETESEEDTEETIKYDKYTFEITNTHIPEVTSISGEKHWSDNDDNDKLRPTQIIVHLIANGDTKNPVATKTVTVDEEGKWKYDFGDLPKYKDGEEITYTITEDPVDFYELTNGEGYDINNTHNIFKTGISITKIWDDNENRDGKRPASIQFRLKADGFIVTTIGDNGVITLDGSEEVPWTYVNNDLPRKANGRDIEYTVEEVVVPENYTYSQTSTTSYKDNIVSTNNSRVVTITATNKHEPIKITKSGTKTWVDGNNQDGKRPASITVSLLADGAYTGKSKTVTPDKDGNWTYEFDNLPQYRTGEVGEEIVYTVVENPVAEYETTLNGMNITNTHDPEKTSINVTKTWNDDYNKDGKRPGKITVHLIKNGNVEAPFRTKEITADDNWSWQINDLDVYENGTKITYTITEDAVTDYTTTIDKYHITNTHTPSKISITGTKTWDDENNQDGKRPESVTINLLENGHYTGRSTTIKGTTDVWTYSFDNLDEYKDGTKITYTVVEDIVNGYTTTYDEDNPLNITNSYTPETTTVSGTKTWDDDNNRDNLRPEFIVVKVIADGDRNNPVKTQQVRVGADGSWTYSFEDLPKKKAGKDIVYTVEEEPVTHYSTTTDGYNITNTHNIFETSVTISKTWDDDNNQDGKRPASVTFILTDANGLAVPTAEPIVLSDANGWTETVSHLPRKANGVDIDYQIREIPVSGYEITYQSSTSYSNQENNLIDGKSFVYAATNTHESEKIDVSGRKTWIDDNNKDGKRPASITVHLLANGTEKSTKVVRPDASGNWTYTFEDLDKYAAGEEITYTVREDAVSGYKTAYDGMNITNTHESSKINIPVTKNWQDNNNQDGKRPEKIIINLLANGSLVRTKELSGTENTWTYTFENVDEFMNGQPINYTITENAVVEYQTSITGDKEQGFVINNTHTPETTSISGTKTWDDANNQDGLRPEKITVKLYADGKLTDKTTEATAANGWTYTFENLPKYKVNQKDPIVYSVKEVVEENSPYEVSYDGNNIINTHTPEKIDIPVIKTWDDEDNQDEKRPASIIVNLLANGSLVRSQSLTAENADEAGNWTYTFEGLDKYLPGKVKQEIKYTITENPVAEYTTTINGYEITNTHTPEEVTISGTKTWNDAANQDGKRPASVTFKLLRDGEDTGITTTATAATNWKYSFTGLPMYVNKKQVSYTVEEVKVPEYEMTKDETGLNFTNTYTPEKIKIEGKKIWDDADDQDGKRPESIRVNLLVNGAYTGKFVTVTAENKDSDGNWKFEFTDLDKYLPGKVKEEITYTVTENPLNGYSTVVTGNQKLGFTITNTHDPETTNIHGTKTWVDDNNRDGARPESIEVRVMNGEEEVASKTVRPDAAGNWTYEFNNLPKNSGGSPINYTIVEDKIAGYTPTYKGYNITNTHEAETVEVKGTKEWRDSNNQDGKRPTSIKINLLADGSYTGKTITLTPDEDGNWPEYNFGKLPKYQTGAVKQEIQYTVTENPVDGYTTTYEGFNTINSHTPSVISISGEKKWDDENNRDGVRPTTITINLMKTVNSNTSKVEETTVAIDSEGKWKYNFENLPEYENGTKIQYFVEEDDVTYYTATKDGDYNIINKHNPFETGIIITKSWIDQENNDGKRPGSVSFILKANGIAVPSVGVITLSNDNNWRYENNNLPRKENGTDIEYTVEELPVDGYTLSKNKFTPTYDGTDTVHGNKTVTFTEENTHTPEKTSVKVTKVWNDNNDQDGKRPGTITVHLWNGEKEVASHTINKEVEKDWTYTFENLEKFEGGKEIQYTVTEDKVDQYTTTISGFTITNTHTPEKMNIPITKTWDDKDNQDKIRPTSIKVNLLANGNLLRSEDITGTGNNWSYTFENLDKYKDGEEISYTITENQISGYETPTITYNEVTKGYDITNKHNPEVIDIHGVKTWDDKDNQDGIRPDKIVVRLYANKAEIAEKTVDASSNWEYTFENLPKKEAGSDITYTVKEDKVDNYETSYDGYNIKNTHTPETTKISGNKTWKDGDNQDGTRPESITINLIANNKVLKSQTITPDEEGNWNYEFDNLPKKESGKDIDYSVTEDQVPGYKTTYDGNNIINTYTPEVVTISGTKTWDDGNNQDGTRPASVTIRLYADGKEINHTTVTQASNWAYAFEDLPKMNKGKTISYSVSEDSVDGYATTQDGYNFINSYTPKKTSVHGTKTWDDKDNQDRTRPTSIVVNLLANGTVIDSKTVTGTSNTWEYDFENLDMYQSGKEITYTVTENPVNSYTTTYDESHLNITNTYKPATINVNGKKVWDDENNRDGLRPDSITITLKANDSKNSEYTTTTSEEKDWNYSFTDLPKYENGKEITYTVQEPTVPKGYTSSVSGTTITNKHEIEKTTISGEKTWKDGNNQDGKRPEEITVNLFANGSLVQSQKVKAKEDGTWTYQFEDLPKYQANAVKQEIKYTITENPVAEYTTEISGFNITNTYTPKKTQIDGKKVWDDADDQDGLRPESITIHLLADNKDTGKTATATAKDGWTYSFEDLDMYQSGKEITYTVKESAVPKGYTSSVAGTTITNTHTPETTKVEGEKTWEDGNNQDGLRPSFINVILKADGVVKETKQVSSATNWKYSFDNLPKSKDGKEIIYTVDEDVVKGYNKAIDGYNIKNTHTPETTTISGKKTWNDNENQDGVRPDSIIINLLADGVKVDSQTLNKKDDGTWPSYSFTDLPVYKEGKKISYTVTEDSVTHYQSEVDGLEIINTHNPFTTEISVEKVWNDDYNRDNVRPTSITVILKADGVAISDQVTLNKRNEWFKKWTGLNRYANGKEINYTVEEVQTAGSEYTATTTFDKTSEDIKADNAKDFTITNTHEFKTVDVAGHKVWNDESNRDGLRPESITINLLADSKVIDTKTITAENNWSYSWTDLPEYLTDAVGHKIYYSVEEVSVPSGYTMTKDGYNIINTHEIAKTEVNGEKIWADNNNQDGLRPATITVNLLADGKVIDNQTVSAANNWKYSFTDLPQNRENKVKEPIEYTVEEAEVPTGYTQSLEGNNIINTHTPETVTITGEKVWDDNLDQDGLRPTSIQVNIKDGSTIVKTIDITGSKETAKWSYEVTSLPKYKVVDGKGGVEINYTVEEVLSSKDKENYTSTVSGTTITNTHKPATINVPISKTWIDNSDSEHKRPKEISVSLKADGKVVKTETITGNDNNWKHTFTNLPKYRDHGIEIKYTVIENNVDKNYQATYPEDRTIINTINNLERDIPVTKIWNDNDNQDGKRPEELKVHLIGTVKVEEKNTIVHEDTITLTAENNNWTGKFEKAPIFYQGTLISYTIEEMDNIDYQVKIEGNSKDGYTITNTHTPEKTEVTATKVWVDSDNNDGLRPTSVTFVLKANGKELGQKVITEKDDWKATFENLDKYQNGTEIDYSVEEINVDPNYTSTIDTKTRTITNTHTPLTITYEIEKIWDDYENQDGKRPESIIVRLYADEEEIDKVEVKADKDGKWKCLFESLPKYKNGKLIQYTITEDPVELYETEDIQDIENTKETKNITNTINNHHDLIPYNDTGEITVRKIWNDENNKYNQRPTFVTIHLYANGVEVATATLNSSNDWIYTFKNLPKYESGKVGVEITYTITEDKVTNYETSIDNFTVTNTYNGPKEVIEITPPNTGIIIDTMKNQSFYELLMSMITLGYTITLSRKKYSE